MRILASTIQPVAREHGKPAAGRGHAATHENRGPDSSMAGPASEAAPSAKTMPPGLERALAHHQSDRNAGQARAFDRISNQIARYVETQAMVTPPAVVPAIGTPEPASDVAASTGTAEPLNSVTTVSAADTTPMTEPAASASADVPVENSASS